MPRAHPVVFHTPSIPLAQAIRDHFSSRPSLQEVAAAVLSKALGPRYPWLVIDENLPLLLEPVYRYSEQGFILQGHERLTLVDALIERFITQDHVDYSQGQVLTNSQSLEHPKALEVKNEDLEDAVNEWGPRLISVYQEVIVKYWTESQPLEPSRFQWLSSLLKQTLQSTAVMSPALTLHQLNLIRDVVAIPDNSLRAVSSGSKAYIVDQWGAAGSDVLEMLRGIVLFEQRDTGDSVLLFTLSGAIKGFASLAELGEELVSLLSGLGPEQQMQWRLYQPAGNIFDSFSLAFLAKQLRDIQDAAPQVSAFNNPGRVLELALKVATVDFDSVRSQGDAQLTKLRKALPGWLMQADPDLQKRMSQWLLDLGKSLQAPGWKPFDEGVPSLHEFSRTALMAQMAKEYPNKQVLDPDLIQVTLRVNQNQDVPTIGVFWRLPLGYSESTRTLTEFSLQSLTGVDAELISISAPEGNDTTWLTYEVVRDLIHAVGIGRAYPALIAQQFREDASQAKWRKMRFIEQLRLQLPMLALETTLRYRTAFSRRAFESVACVWNADAALRRVGGQDIVLRPLAFKARADASPDTVLNMFLIGPRDAAAGPHILYRPMAAVKLIEFKTLQAVFDAIKAPGALQYDVLAWLPDAARRVYVRDGFSAPHISILNALDFAQSLWSTAPALLDDQLLTGDYPEILYERMVDALLSLADQQTVSDTEAFWTWLKLKGGMTLGVVLPLVGGPVARLGGWLLLAWSAVTDIHAIEDGDTLDRLQGFTDLLMNIGLLVLSSGGTLRRVQAPVIEDALLDQARGVGFDERSIELAWQEEADQELEGGQQSRASSNVQLPATQTASPLVRSQSLLEQPWEGLYRRMSAMHRAEAELFRVQPPANPQRIGGSGRTQGLYRDEGGLFAQVQGGWYEVVDSGIQFMAIDTQSPFSQGPELIGDDLGQWSFRDDRTSQEASTSQQAQFVENLAYNARRRQELEAQYRILLQELEAQDLTDDEFLQALKAGADLDAREQRIIDQLVRMEVAIWRATKLTDFLKMRRRLEVIKGFSALSNRFAASGVQAWRNQVALLASRYNIMLASGFFEARLFDASQLPAVLMDAKVFPALSKRLPQYLEFQAKAIGICAKAEQAFEDMRLQGRAQDTSVQQLSTPAWSDKRMSFKWKSLQLRSQALLCFKPEGVRVNDSAFDVINEVNQLCSFKLMTCIELFEARHFTLAQQLRVLNDAFDALVMADCKLTYQMRGVRGNINYSALDGYVVLVRALRNDVEEQLLRRYESYEAAWPEAAPARAPEKTQVIIQTRLRGLLIGNLRAQAEGPSTEFEYVDLYEPFDRRVVESFKRTLGASDETWSQVARPLVLPVNKTDYGRFVAAVAEVNRLLLWAPIRLKDAEHLARLPLISAGALRAELLLYAKQMVTQHNVTTDAMQTLGMLGESGKPSEEVQTATRQLKALETELSKFMEAAQRLSKTVALTHSPSSEALQVLFNAGHIEVEEIINGGGVPQARDGGLFRYFEVREPQSGRVLWVAHFHYATASARDSGYAFSRAHIKPFAWRSIGYFKLQRNAITDDARLNVFRMNIDPEVARTVFFSGLAER